MFVSRPAASGAVFAESEINGKNGVKRAATVRLPPTRSDCQIASCAMPPRTLPASMLRHSTS